MSAPFPLDEPHLRALRWACEQRRGDLKDDHIARVVAHTLETYGDRGQNDPPAAALRVLLSPTIAAALIRDLLARAGIEPCGKVFPTFPDMACCRAKGHKPPHADCIGNDGFECASGEHHAQDWKGDPVSPNPTLILALLDATDASAALRALKEAGR